MLCSVVSSFSAPQKQQKDEERIHYDLPEEDTIRDDELEAMMRECGVPVEMFDCFDTDPAVELHHSLVKEHRSGGHKDLKEISGEEGVCSELRMSPRAGHRGPRAKFFGLWYTPFQ